MQYEDVSMCPDDKMFSISESLEAVISAELRTILSKTILGGFEGFVTGGLWLPINGWLE